MHSRLSLQWIATPAILAAMTLAFSPRAAAQTETVLHSFDNNHKDASNPRAGLILDKAGNLYGTTIYGGVDGGGSIFEMKPKAGGGWNEMVLHSFKPPRYTFDQISSLVLDSAGNLYGTTSLGGASNDGTVYEMVRQPGGGWTEKELYSFRSTGSDGTLPLAGVIMDSAGNLYGTTVYGGSGSGCTILSPSCGTVFELSPQADGGWVEKILHNFVNDGTDGVNPYFGLVFDAAGNLYGTTLYGGANDQGTVFELSPSASGWTETVIHTFGSGSDAGLPQGLTLNNGNLYGTSGYFGGAGNVFQLTPTSGGGWSEQILYEFPSTGNGPNHPGGNLTFDPAGNIYGVTGEGGTGLNGTVFKLSQQSDGTWSETTLVNFNDLGTNGANPDAGLVIDPQGNIYGTTIYGGTYRDGVVFEITP